MRSGRGALLVLSVACAAAVGATAAVVAVRPPLPAALADAEQIGTVAVTERVHDDARSLGLTLTLGAERAVLTAAGGRLTGAACAPGGRLVSGESAFGVDGVGLVNVATDLPLWRDLAVGERGPDARALNAELGRLGYEAADSDAVTQETARGFAALVTAATGVETAPGTIPASRVVWLPEHEVAVASCEVVVGDAVEPAQRLATVPTTLAAASLTAMPVDAPTGPRVLVLDGERIAIDADGAVSDPEALAVIAASPGYRQALLLDSANPSLTVSWLLAEPLPVEVVPPSAVFGITAGQGCVALGDEVRPVSVVGSELGQTFVLAADDRALDRVDLHPDPALPCG